MLMADATEEGEMARRGRDRPIGSYEEYLRRYPPRDAEQLDLPANADPARVGEERGSRAVERAAAQLATSDASRT